MKKFFALFIVANLGLSAFFIDTWLTHNPGSRAIPMITLFEQGTLKIDRYEKYTLDKSRINGHYYSDKAPLSTFITLPFYGMARLSGLEHLGPDRYPAYSRAYTQGHRPVYNDTFVFPGFWAYATGSLMCGSLPFVLILTAAAWMVRRVNPSVSPVWLVCLPFYGSFVFVYAGAFFGHLLAALLLLLSCILLKRGRPHFYAGLLLGAAFLAEYPVGLALPLWAVLIVVREKSVKKAAAFVGGFLPGLLANSFYVFIITGSPFSMPYSHVSHEGFAPMRQNLGFGLPQPEALWHLLVSPYRGLLFFAPFLAVVLVVFLWRKEKQLGTVALDYTAWFSVCFVLLFSSYYMWDGGYAYGPRHLIPVAVLLIYEGVVWVSRTKQPLLWFYSIAAAGVGMSWMAKSTVAFLADPAVSNPFFSIIVPEFTAGRFNPNNLLTMMFGLPPMAGVIAWPLLFVGLMIVLDRAYSRYSTK
ncbi:hypothetical protein [Desulfosudis oleivorans]|uniref:DUF2029 domain-containing protein n=1 Tax=Desulfosudis oleivorans (strain DSM 6200 / JCM 39069 / Hxd3) TaxID=96561 RepID=A8ZZP3_DESOH|nr:hypothetical protein [Desulfosudis oleivorans]ABW68915.1 hypothetical protein Dole_3112 [Desulfosudis oleivorans Hxd3]